jgi:ribose/xylose/arabinose/galactoside ABC-type transport system permease subunit
MVTVEKKSAPQTNKLVSFFLDNKALVILFVLVIVAEVISNGIFLTPENLEGVVRQVAVACILGVGFSIVIAALGIDLSVGYMVSLLGVLYAIMSLNMPFVFAILLTLLLGFLFGFGNGFIIQQFKLNPFVVTLATAQIFRGAASLLTHGAGIVGLSDNVKFVGQEMVLGIIPFSFLIVLTVTVIIAVLVYRTKFGRHLMATGGNIEAARVSGVNVKAIQIAAYVAVGLCCAISSIVLTGRVAVALPAAAAGIEMDIVAAVVIGGTPMSGGKINIVGTIIGCFIMGIINNSLNLVGVDAFWQWVAKGVIIILAIYLDSKTQSFFKSRQKFF